MNEKLLADIVARLAHKSAKAVHNNAQLRAELAANNEKFAELLEAAEFVIESAASGESVEALAQATKKIMA